MFLISLMTLVFANLVFADEPLTIVTADESFGVYMTISEEGDMKTPSAGFEYDFMNVLCQEMQMECQWKAIPGNWSETPLPGILSEVQTKKADLAIAFMRGTDTRLELLKASAPYLQTKTAVFGLASKDMVFLDDVPLFPTLTPVSFATVGGYKDSVEKLYATSGLDSSYFTITEVESDDQVVESILSGSVAATYSTAENAILNDKLDILNLIQPSASLEWGPRIYSHDDQLMDEINKAFQAVVSSGVYCQLLKKHGLETAAALEQSWSQTSTMVMKDFDPSCVVAD